MPDVGTVLSWLNSASATAVNATAALGNALAILFSFL